MTFDVEAARRVASSVQYEPRYLLAACDEIERLRERVGAQEESLIHLTDEYTDLRAQLGIAAVALGRIADLDDDEYGSGVGGCAVIAREALLRMREGQE